MRLLIASDLHHELWREHAPMFDPSVSKPDAVVLAGDIDTGAKAVAWAVSAFSNVPVMYVQGNHEAYGKILEEVPRDIQEACRAVDNVHFLDCTEIVLNGIRFLGTCLWTDFKLFGNDMRQAAMREAEATMVDYARIRLAGKGYRKLRAADTAQLHAQQRLWLQKRLDGAFNGKTVVITHMAPSMHSVSDQYATDLVSAAFASHLDHLVEKADLWVHGHTHESFDYVIGKCRIVSNPCGYMNRSGGTENTAFDPNFVVEI